MYVCMFVIVLTFKGDVCFCFKYARLIFDITSCRVAPSGGVAAMRIKIGRVSIALWALVLLARRRLFYVQFRKQYWSAHQLPLYLCNYLANQFKSFMVPKTLSRPPGCHCPPWPLPPLTPPHGRPPPYSVPTAPPNITRPCPAAGRNRIAAGGCCS